MSIARFGDWRTRVLNSQSRRSDGSASSAESGMALAESATPSTAPSTVRAGNLPTSANESSEAEQIERLFSQFSDVDQVIILEVLEACGDAQIAASRLDDMRRANPLPPPKMCIICEESPRATRFGCGHACCCQECTQRLMAMAEPRCPTCRAPVTKLSTGGGSMGALGVSVARQPTYAKPAEVAFDVNYDSVVSFGNAEPSGRIETPPRHRIETPPRHRIETPPRHRERDDLPQMVNELRRRLMISDHLSMIDTIAEAETLLGLNDRYRYRPRYSHEVLDRANSCLAALDGLPRARVASPRNGSTRTSQPWQSCTAAPAAATATAAAASSDRRDPHAAPRRSEAVSSTAVHSNASTRPVDQSSRRSSWPCEGFCVTRRGAALRLCACWLLLFAGSLVMIILGALTLTGDLFVPGQHLCNFSVSDITCDKHEYEEGATKWTTVWPNANIVNGSRCPLYWGPYNEHGSEKDCTSNTYELRRRYTSSDNATGTAQLVCWGPEWTHGSSLGHSQACFTRAVPANRGTRSLIYWMLLFFGPFLLCFAAGGMWIEALFPGPDTQCCCRRRSW